MHAHDHKCCDHGHHHQRRSRDQKSSYIFTVLCVVVIIIIIAGGNYAFEVAHVHIICTIFLIVMLSHFPYAVLFNSSSSFMSEVAKESSNSLRTEDTTEVSHEVRKSGSSHVRVTQYGGSEKCTRHVSKHPPILI